MGKQASIELSHSEISVKRTRVATQRVNFDKSKGTVDLVRSWLDSGKLLLEDSFVATSGGQEG